MQLGTRCERHVAQDPLHVPSMGHRQLSQSRAVDVILYPKSISVQGVLVTARDTPIYIEGN
jgi:hypothetical protein